ncbi:MAG TPA: NAD(P)/FAD-dependent oxidoreductase, partial [Blastocatellia bacterium]
AYIPDPRTGKPYPPTAQHAVREGKTAARNIAANFGVGERRAFDYRSKGQMALIGERTGIAEIMGYRFSGFFAWFLWRTYYLMQVPLFEKRIRILMDWTADLFFTPDIVQLGITRARQIESTPRAVAMISRGHQIDRRR